MEMIFVVAGADNWGHMGNWGWGMAWFGMVMMISIIALVIWAVVYSARRPADKAPKADRAQTLLDERYAAGEIDRDDYLQRKTDLER